MEFGGIHFRRLGVTMYGKPLKLIYYGLFLLAAILWKDTFPTYIEGIDTTDANGYGLDSAFRTDNAGFVLQQNIACYSSPLGYCGLFNYSFDEIKMATDSFTREGADNPSGGRCIAVMNGKDSTFAKVQLLKGIGGNRYSFRYGKNSIPNNRMMDSSNYDRSVRYKPNNVFSGSAYFQWEPPLPNDNHLVGYIVYVQKPGIPFDSSAPINIAQWDSITFTASTSYVIGYPYIYIEGVPYDFSGSFFNIVAVYTEGRSDFLKGWTRITKITRIVQPPFSGSLLNGISIQEENGGFFFSLPVNQQNASLAIYKPSGQLITRLSFVNCNHVFWDARQRNFAYGLFIVRAELLDHTIFTKPFMVTK